ncbi:MAG: hypothetical protein CL477_08270 [Acidobacteria bacterium]|jgi:hypothetical protein|nr:hypothetical protein [Acidobacteriota bacterium]MDP7479399.1 PilZ domain-containing protein [Vicinamibacterales bacterium]MDP7692319.1 PilZ domain-containing protein [Vicinamibacterales bacterium]HJN47069.1 PilZ domain-containing protein [Vicinamibacterales bacterium]|tara:strand:+ start:475 stop:819 length:345 start_codon:yes stop_codon:yes gene_type:complete
MTEADRRDTTRVELLGDLRGEVMVYQPMTVTEISDRGAQIETSFPLQLGSLHDLRLALGSSSVVVKGRVAHARVSQVEQAEALYKSGIEFVEPSAQVAAAISAFVTELRAQAGS